MAAATAAAVARLAVVAESLFPLQANLGICGNLLNLAVLLSEPLRRSRTNVMLALAALCDIIFFVALVPKHLQRRAYWLREPCTESSPPPSAALEALLRDGNQTLCPTAFFVFYQANAQHFAFVANWFSTLSSWLIVLISFDRLWAIKNPLAARRCSGSSRFCHVTSFALLLVMSALVTIHHSLALSAVVSGGSSSSGGDANAQSGAPFSRSFASLLRLLNLVAQIVLPLSLLVFSNTFLIYYLRSRQELLEQCGGGSEQIRLSCDDDDNNRPVHKTTATFHLTDDNTSSQLDHLDNNNNSDNSITNQRHLLIRKNNSQPWSSTSATGDGRTATAVSSSANNHHHWVSVNNSVATISCKQRRRSERRVTIIVAVIVSSYIVTHLPSALVYLYHTIFQDGPSVHVQAAAALSNSLVIWGKVANFFLFCLSSRHFRSQLKSKLLRTIHYEWLLNWRVRDTSIARPGANGQSRSLMVMMQLDTNNNTSQNPPHNRVIDLPEGDV